MQFIIADMFTRSLARLDRQSQGLIKLAVFDFQTQPETPGFQLHRLDKGKEKNFWSARVSSDLRMIVHRTEGSATLCYVDHHDAAYAWAERRRFEVHPQTGAAQIVEVVERQEVVVVTKGVELLFGRFEADYLLALGVPTEWLDSVRAADWEGIDKLIAHLPAEAAERRLQLAAGQPVPRPVKPAEATPFTHPDVQRRFRVVDNQRELQQALDAP